MYLAKPGKEMAMAYAKSILTVTGPSGTGKTTLVGKLLASTPCSQMIPSTTTRKKRESDLPGEYNYVEQDWFNLLRRSGEFLWDVERGDTCYGTVRSDVRDLCGKDGYVGVMILVPSTVEHLRAFVRDQYPEVRIVSLYLEPPDEETLQGRLRTRGESPDEIQKRMRLEREWLTEARAAPHFMFVNGGPTLADLDRVVERVRLLITR